MIYHAPLAGALNQREFADGGYFFLAVTARLFLLLLSGRSRATIHELFKNTAAMRHDYKAAFQSCRQRKSSREIRHGGCAPTSPAGALRSSPPAISARERQAAVPAHAMRARCRFTPREAEKQAGHDILSAIRHDGAAHFLLPLPRPPPLPRGRRHAIRRYAQRKRSFATSLTIYIRLRCVLWPRRAPALYLDILFIF